MKSHRRVLAVTVAALSAAVVLSACQGGSSDAGPPASVTPRAITIALDNYTDLDTLDPQTSTNSVAAEVSGFMYDTLVNVKNGQVVSGLAESWTAEDNIVTFDLVDGVTCSDGTPLTANAVAASMERFRDSSPVAVKQTGSKDWTVTADDAANTVTFSLPSPFGPFVTGIANTSAAIVCPAGLEAGADFMAQSYGTGAFVLDEVSPGVEYSMTAREGYTWGAGGESTERDDFPSEVTFTLIATESAAVNMFVTDELDIVRVYGSERSRIEDDDRYFGASEISNTLFLQFNQAPGHPTADPAVRLAIAQAIDRQVLSDVAFSGYGTLAEDVLSPAAACFVDRTDVMPTSDPEAAAEVLSTLDADLTILGWNQLSSAPEVLLTALTNAGATAHVDGLDAAGMLDRQNNSQDWDVSMFTFSDHTSPSNFLRYFSGDHPPTGNNYPSIDNADYTALGLQALAEPDQDAQCELWSQAHDTLLESVNTLPLSYRTKGMFGNGVTFEPRQYSQLDPASLTLTR